MKTIFIILLVSLVVLNSCRREASNPTHVLSIAAFKMDSREEKPTAAELVALKSFVMSRYNPYFDPIPIDDKKLKDLGFQLMFVMNRETSKIDGIEVVCSQGLPWGSEPKALTVFRKYVEGAVEIHAFSSERRGNNMPSSKSHIGYEDIGVHVFDDGLIISWVTKPIAQK